MKYVILVILLITVSMGQVPQTTFSTEADTYITPDGGPMVNHGSETELLISLAPPREALLYADVSTGLNLFDLNSEDLFQTIVSGSLQLSINSVVCSSAVKLLMEVNVAQHSGGFNYTPELHLAPLAACAVRTQG